MSKDAKLGTFGGVFTPSVLTILGVIMYLRLPWVLGNAGLLLGLGIIAAAHVVSVTTGLSISSIATDKKVGRAGLTTSFRAASDCPSAAPSARRCSSASR